ncbi:hypothetical protein [Entomomonas asaccharolytica]|uniref:Uncharacterized protein n=1 Tax=Entomomonas asaccharolytica TaxID=2785331 RepID=A0A974NDF3_9GAMM|nr:hypothetical protein [Entomomonas asaccharolytica]QQP84474.1 hypothetical protein JHT90_08560 [Entomomonas asaccharolytica]
MKIAFASKTSYVSSTNILDEYVVEVPIPAEVKAAKDVGKTIWYLSDAFLANRSTNVNNNKMVMLASASYRYGLWDIGNYIRTQICGVQQYFGPPPTVFNGYGGNPAIFGVELLKEDVIYFSARKVDDLDELDRMDFYVSAQFFIPE